MNAILPSSFRDFADATGQRITSEIVVDSFAGGGGASLGIERALKRLHALGLLGDGDPSGVNVAINHDAPAIAMHMANHPNTLHLHHDIWSIDPLTVTNGYPVGLLWASPDCRHHSKAKGGRPVSASVRDLAWVVAHWAEQVRPRMFFLENVEEFQDWGPLVADKNGDQRPDKVRKGQDFKRWVAKFRKLGYRVEWREIRARIYGAPTLRKRLYIIMRNDGQPIVWPAQTHGDPDSDEVKSGKLLPWPLASDSVIDWSLPCPSILMNKEEARAYTKATGTKIIRPLAWNTMARIAKGVKRYVIDEADPFIVTCNHSGDEFRGQGIREGFKTVAASRDAHGLVMPHLSAYYGDSAAGGNDRSAPVDDSLRTVTTEPRHAVVQAEIAPFVTYGQQGGLSRPADESFHTATASSKDTNAVAAVFLGRQFGNSVGSAAEDSVGTITAGGGGKTQAIAAYLAQHNTDVIGHDARDSVSTLVGKGSTQGVVAAHMISMKGGDRRHYPATRSVEAITAQGQHAGVVMPFMTAYFGSDEVGAASDASMRTVTAKPRFAHVEAEIAPPPLSDAQLDRARQVAAFLREHGCWDEREFVTVGPWIVIDIGMRMLTPRELARAQGFPDVYILAAPYKGGVLTDTDQRHKIGNSVCPDVAEALVFANFRPAPRPVPINDQGWLFEVAA